MRRDTSSPQRNISLGEIGARHRLGDKPLPPHTGAAEASDKLGPNRSGAAFYNRVCLRLPGVCVLRGEDIGVLVVDEGSKKFVLASIEILPILRPLHASTRIESVSYALFPCKGGTTKHPLERLPPLPRLTVRGGNDWND